MNHIVEICVSTPEELKEAMSLSKYCFWRKSVISIHYNYGVEKIRHEIREIDSDFGYCFSGTQLEEYSTDISTELGKGYNVGITSIFNADVEDLLLHSTYTGRQCIKNNDRYGDDREMDKNNRTDFDGIKSGDEDELDISGSLDIIAQMEAALAELDRREKELDPEEEKLFMCVRETLLEHGLKYIYDADTQRVIEVMLGEDNMPFRMQINLRDSRLVCRSTFPFRIQCNSLALVALYITEFNAKRELPSIKMDMEKGEVVMEYSYFLKTSIEYDKKRLWFYIDALISPMFDAYQCLHRLAVGKVSKDSKDYYRALLEKSLAVIDGHEEDEQYINYGSSGLKGALEFKD